MTALAAQLPDFLSARRNMIEGQIRPNKVRDERVLTTLETLPRELFVPEHLAGVAYIDESMPVSAGRYLLQPMVLARLLEESRITATDTVLDIAPATGYSTAALAHLAGRVVAVESDADLQKRGVALIQSLGLTNVESHLAPLSQGWKTNAPYDVILINGSVDIVPDSLLLQLKDGGRLAVVVRNYAAAHVTHTGDARLYERLGDKITYRSLFDANVALLPGFAAPAKFSF